MSRAVLTLHGAAAQRSRAEAPLPPIAYVPPAVSRRGRRQRASSDAHQKPKAASISTLPWPHPEPSVRGRPDGCRCLVAALILELAP